MHCGAMVDLFTKCFADREFLIYKCIVINDPEFDDPDDYDHTYVLVQDPASGKRYVVESWNNKFAPRFYQVHGLHIPDRRYFSFTVCRHAPISGSDTPSAAHCS